MPNQFFSPEGDIENYFVTEYWMIDQWIGDTLWTWGQNSYGQLGVNDTTQRLTPVTTLLGGTNWKSIASERYYTIAIKTDGSLWSWGDNFYGSLGVNDTKHRSTPVTTLLGGNNWKSIASGWYHTLALKTDGSLWSWGNNAYGQLGVNDTTGRSTPVTTLLGGNNWKSVSCGSDHTIALKTDGSLWSWGRNAYGQLGTNDTTHISTPVTTLLGGTNWKSIACGTFHTVALKTDGSLWSWGHNDFGQLGVNDTTHRFTPVTTLLGGTNWKSIASGGLHMTIAIKTDGSLWSWGRNANGQLGVNDTTHRSTPVTTLLGGTNWKSIAGGFNQTVALKTDGSLWSWGSNAYGQLGVNDTTHRSTPVTTLLGGNNWKSIASGLYHTIALTAGVNFDIDPPWIVEPNRFDLPVGITTITYPSGISPGDLVVVIQHNFTSGGFATPVGFTSIFQTPANPYGYGYHVSTKICGIGETSFTIDVFSSSSGFSNVVFSLKNKVSVSPTYSMVTPDKTSINTSVNVSGTAIVLANDRGATGLPRVSPTGDFVKNNFNTGYFYNVFSAYKNYTANSVITITDFSDTYSTSALVIVAQ